MASLAVDEDGTETIWEYPIVRELNKKVWMPEEDPDFRYIYLPKGSIEKLIGYKITWEDEAVKI